VRGITDLMVMPGLINLDFADVRSVMSEMGKAMMGTGEADGEHRAIEAAERAIANPLLDDISMKGARGVLINITGGPDLTLFEVDEAANRIREEVDPEANIIVGSTLDANMEGRMRVSVVATGIDAAAQMEPKPQATPSLRLVTPPQAKPISFGGAAKPAAQGGGQAAAMSQPAPQPTMAAAPAPTVAQVAVALQSAPEASPQPADMPVTAAQAEPAVAAAPLAEAQPQAPARPFATAAQMASEAAAPHFMPTRAQPIPARPAETLRQPDAFAEADMVNRPAEPKKKASLFDRITGAARSRLAEPDAQPVMRQAEPQFSRPAMPAPAAVARPAEAQPASRQTDLGLAPAAERSPQSRPQDDLLDIPAFLRRQAN
jgi:cell division protein FtsZ